MALGLFSSLIVGLILSQLGKIPFLGFLLEITPIFDAKSPVVGAAIGCAIAFGLKCKPLVIFSSCVTGAIGYSLGGPVGAYFAAIVGCELGSLVAGKTKVDIIIAPVVTIVSGGAIALLIGPPIQGFMQSLGDFINQATMLSPLPMGIVIAVVVGMCLTAPISSAALCIMIGISGLAAGAATVGCCAQMVGFAIAGLKDNGGGSLISVGLGTSMLQFSNILRRPQIWIAPTLAGAILGPISTCVFKMTNTAAGAGMGTAGLVGQFGTFAAMGETASIAEIFLPMLLLHFVAPVVLVVAINAVLKKLGWIKDGDFLLDRSKADEAVFVKS